MRRAAFLTASAAALSLAGCSLLRSSPPTYNVFFADASARIDDPARVTIVEAARVANARPSDPVVLGGFANTRGVDTARSAELARQRVEAVSAALAAVGVNPTRIQRATPGEDPQTASGIASRRVEIDIGR